MTCCILQPLRTRRLARARSQCESSNMTALPGSATELARLIDHTLLDPKATVSAVDELCNEAKAHGLLSVCVNPCWVAHAKQRLQDTEVLVCTVVGFPLGANSTQTKAAEAAHAVAECADELDMVMNVGWFRSGWDERVRDDIAAVVAEARGRVVKVILEIALLDLDGVARASALAVAAGASFVKTSTGFGPGGATIEAIATMRRVVGPTIGVKASGGIRNAANARAMLEAGASRIGASASIAILNGWT
jgi:deoxyribose-phosphate aldolase